VENISIGGILHFNVVDEVVQVDLTKHNTTKSPFQVFVPLRSPFPILTKLIQKLKPLNAIIGGKNRRC
jgi:hypothetical protein